MRSARPALASADIWLGRFDGSKYVPPQLPGDAGSAPASLPSGPAGDRGDPEDPEDPAARERERRLLENAKPRGAAIHDADGTVLCHAETPEKAVEALRELLTLAGPAGRLDLTRANRKLFDRLAQRRDNGGKWAREQLEMVRLAELAA